MAMKDSNEFQPIPSNSVGNDVGGVGNDKFSCSEHPPRSSHLGVRLKKVNRF